MEYITKSDYLVLATLHSALNLFSYNRNYIESKMKVVFVRFYIKLSDVSIQKHKFVSRFRKDIRMSHIIRKGTPLSVIP